MSLRVRRKNWKLRRQRSKLEKDYNRVAKESKQKKREDILDEWYGANGWEFDVIDAQIKENTSNEIIREAEKLYLPTPSYNDKDKWISEDDLGISASHRLWVLTPEAMTELNRAIRQEKKARLRSGNLELRLWGLLWRA